MKVDKSKPHCNLTLVLSSIPITDCESALSGIASCLTQSSSTPKRLHIWLQAKSRQSGCYEKQACLLEPRFRFEAATTAVHLLGPSCGPLTHITVLVQSPAYYKGSFFDGYRAFLIEVRAVFTSTLTHLSYSCDQQLPFPCSNNHTDETLYGGYEVILGLRTALELSAFRLLTYLKLAYGCICDKQVWAALPPSLQSLDIRAAYAAPHNGLLLPNLLDLSFQHSRCHELKKILTACPNLHKLSIVKLFTPSSTADLEDLDSIMSHPVWSKESSSLSPSSFPTQLHTHIGEWRLQQRSDEEVVSAILPPHILISHLPMMSAILDFRFVFSGGETLLQPPPAERLLHHIPRAFPFLRVLHLKGLFLADSDLVQLHACKSLCRLEICASAHITGVAAIQLAAVLPKLVRFDLERCQLVTPDQEIAIHMLCEAHTLLPG